MEITWLGHGTFQFRLPSGQVILMDPWTDGNPAYPKGYEIQRVDTICISHGHFDHIHDAVPLATEVLAGCRRDLRDGALAGVQGRRKTAAHEQGRLAEVGDVTVTMTHAIHSCGILDDGKIIYGGEAAGLRSAPPGQARHLLRGRHQRLLRYGTHRAVVPSGTRLPADRRSLYDEPARSRARLPPASSAQGYPDALRHLSAADRPPR